MALSSRRGSGTSEMWADFVGGFFSFRFSGQHISLPFLLNGRFLTRGSDQVCFFFPVADKGSERVWRKDESVYVVVGGEGEG